MRALLLIASTLYAAWSPSPAPVRIYLCSQFLFHVVIEGSLIAGLKIESPFYLALFAVATSMVLIAGLWATIYYVTLLPHSRKVETCGLLLFCVLWPYALSGIHHKLTPFDFVSVTAGAFLAGLAVMLGIVTPLLFVIDKMHARTACALTLLFIGLAAWSLGWPMVWDMELWQKLNFVIPTMFIVASMSYVGYTFRNARIH
jgi:hypothetical protein